jgi:hypothetical protein
MSSSPLTMLALLLISNFAIVSATAATVTAATNAPVDTRVAKQELRPEDAISTVRVMPNQLAPGNAIDGAMTSPDGKRFVIRTAHGDVALNGVWVDLWTATLDSLKSASHLVRCAHLLTTGLGSANNHSAADNDPEPSNLVRWMDNRHVAFLWNDAHQIRQVIEVDLVACEAYYLTHSSTNVFSFARTPQGTLVYDAQIPTPPASTARMLARGFTVADVSDAWSIFNGDFDAKNVSDKHFNSRWFVRSAAGVVRPVHIDGRPVDFTNPNFRELAVSPAGRFAVMHTGLQAAPDDWNLYNSPDLKSLLASNTTYRNRLPLRYTVIDLHDATSHPLWNAPKNPRSQAAFSPNSAEVLLAPTFLPLSAHDAPGSGGTAAAVVDAESGLYKKLPIDLTGLAVTRLAWVSPVHLQISTTDLQGDNSHIQDFFRNAAGWEMTPNDATQSTNAIKVEIRQDLNHPPRMFAVDSKRNESRLIFDPDPLLQDRFKLGHIERLSGTTSSGRQWLGQLIFPADYVPGHRYPLVIQSLYGVAWGDEEFTLYGSWGETGMGLGPTDVAAYLGQLLATKNIAVLQLEVLHPGPGVGEAQDYQSAFETVAEQFSASGLADRNRIALDGFSRNGYWVEYTLAHSKFPFAAAIAADNLDPSYFQSALADWRESDAELNGAPAFGPGLQEWIKHAPGFNAEYIHTPLRMIGQSSSISFIIGEWEIYSRLHHLHKPVEMYLMPGTDKFPSHTPQNPRQILAIQ